MSLSKANITLANGTLGNLASLGLPVGIAITGVAEGTIALDAPITVTSLADAVAQGLTLSLNPLAYKAIKEFYLEAGDGTISYWMFKAATVTAATIADGTQATGIKKLVDYGAGAIRFVGILATPSTSITVANGLDGDVYTAAANLQTTLNNYATNNNWPMRGLIGGTSFSGTSTALTNMKNSTLNRVAILIGDTVNTPTTSAVGLLLGRRTSIPSQRKVSRVKDNALAVLTAFIGTTAADQYTTTSTIHDRGFITFRSFAGKNGFFFTGDPTLTADSDDYNTWSRGAVIDDAHLLAYRTYVNEVDDEVPMEKDGTINAGYARHLEQIIEDQINGVMTANARISGVKAYVNPAQNVLSSGIINIVLKVQPVGYASDIEVKLGFATSL